MLPAGQGGHGVAFHQGGNVAAHAVVPGAAVWVDLGGVASAVANSSTQIGGSIGLSVFTAVYVSAVNSGVSVTDEATQLESFAGGYGAVFLAAAVGMIVASIIATTLIRGKKEDLLPQGDIAAGGH